MKTLKLFNAVVAKPTEKKKPFISEDGYIIVPEALWAKDRIIRYYNALKLSGEDLNKTFHKNWKKVKETPRYELLLEQIKHYLSTYGTDFQGEVYIPDEVLDVPDVKIKFKVINAYAKKEMQEKALDMLRSGMALKEETVDDLLIVLHDELDYVFTGDEGIKNREAVIKIVEQYNIFPKDPVEVLRYCVYRSTDSSLLIKNESTYTSIKDSSFNPNVAFKKAGLKRMAEVFNRFKPIFISYKDKCPKTINKISKLSKEYHKPMRENLINLLTTKELTSFNVYLLDKVNAYTIFRGMNALKARFMGQKKFVYNIRNGKSWTTIDDKQTNRKLCLDNYNFLKEYLAQRWEHLNKLKVYLPDDIDYALPTSEKNYVGNVPMGSSFYGETIAVGMYWENAWGARDLDLSGLDLNGNKVGWNARYSKSGLIYSGDQTNAKNGAVEYLYAENELPNIVLVNMNIYSGEIGCKYNIIVGKGSNIEYDYMMNPNNLFLNEQSVTTQKQNTLGLLLPDNNEQRFVLLGYGGGEARVSGDNERSRAMLNAMYMKWTSVVTLSELLRDLKVEIVDDPEKADYDFSLDSLEKDSFIKIFE
ncbi:MAG: hypothetical protein ACOCWM_02225 [Cyclobacteriaceae bacterium]